MSKTYLSSALMNGRPIQCLISGLKTIAAWFHGQPRGHLEAVETLSGSDLDDVVKRGSEDSVTSSLDPDVGAVKGTLAGRGPVRTPLVPCYLADLLMLDECTNLERISTFEPVVVHMPPITAGRHLLATLEIRENAAHMPWYQDSYTAYSSGVYMIRDAILHGSVGITGVAEYAVLESLWHTTPERHRYERDGDSYADRIVLLEGNIETLARSHVSLLVGGAESYWHSVVDVTARLALVPDDILRRSGSVLLPSTGVAQKELIDLYGLPDGVEARLVDPTESFRIENLVYPSSIHYVFDYHPTPLCAFFDRILSRLGENGLGPSFVYVDRRASGLRPLMNEDALAQALERLGFIAVCLEQLSVREQVLLFRSAEVIVAPHGAGLTNIGFSKPGCWIIELMMDQYLNWCYRRIAAIRSLRYDCLVGRAVRTQGVSIDSIHGQPWLINVEDVVAFVSECMTTVGGQRDPGQDRRLSQAQF